MKYLQINSEFIDREFNKILHDAIQGIKHSVSDNRDKGTLDSVMSKFGKRLDVFTDSYLLDHIRVSRKFNHRDQITPEIVKVVNTYRRLGVHKMFEKLYPNAFKKRGMLKSENNYETNQDTIKTVMSRVLASILSSYSAGLNGQDTRKRLIRYLSDDGIKNVSKYFNGLNASIVANSITILRDRMHKISSRDEDIIREIVEGYFDVKNQEPQAPPMMDIESIPGSTTMSFTNTSFSLGENMYKAFVSGNDATNIEMVNPPDIEQVTIKEGQRIGRNPKVVHAMANQIASESFSNYIKARTKAEDLKTRRG